MPPAGRFISLLVVAVLAACDCRPAAADYPDPYAAQQSPPAGWPERSGTAGSERIPQGSAHGVSQAPSPPRLLPMQFQSGTSSSGAPAGGETRGALVSA